MLPHGKKANARTGRALLTLVGETSGCYRIIPAPTVLLLDSPVLTVNEAARDVDFVFGQDGNRLFGIGGRQCLAEDSQS